MERSQTLGITIAGIIIGTFAFLQQGRVGALLVVASVCLIFLALRYPDFLAAWSERKRSPRRVIPFVGAGVVFVASTATYLALFDKEALGDPYHQVFVDGSMENTLIFTVRRMGAVSETLVGSEDEPELHIVLERRIGDTAWLIERSVSLGNKDYTPVRGLPDGLYRAQLLFYGIRLDTVSAIDVNRRRGAYVQLSLPPYRGCVRFRLVSESDTPLEGAYLSVFAGEGLPAIRGSHTDSRGTTQCVWLYSTRIDPDAYSLRITAGSDSGTTLLTDYPFRPVFIRQWERKDALIPVPQP